MCTNIEGKKEVIPIVNEVYYLVVNTNDIFSYEEEEKLDGVAPLITDPPPTSSTTLSYFLKIIFNFFFIFSLKKKLHVTGDMLHLTGDTCHMTCDT